MSTVNKIAEKLALWERIQDLEDQGNIDAEMIASLEGKGFVIVKKSLTDGGNVMVRNLLTILYSPITQDEYDEYIKDLSNTNPNSKLPSMAELQDALNKFSLHLLEL